MSFPKIALSGKFSEAEMCLLTMNVKFTCHLLGVRRAIFCVEDQLKDAFVKLIKRR